jgi:hypothetical protein
MRGLFEYLYRADGLTLVPHIPPSITELEQLDPVRFGSKKLFLSVKGSGPITGVTVNGKKWKSFNAESAFLPFDKTPKNARVEILLGVAKSARHDELEIPRVNEPATFLVLSKSFDDAQTRRLGRVMAFQGRLFKERLDESYEASHAGLVLGCAQAVANRDNLRRAGKLELLPEPSQAAADKLFVETVFKLCDGLEAKMQSYQNATDLKRRKVFELWQASEKDL